MSNYALNVFLCSPDAVGGGGTPAGSPGDPAAPASASSENSAPALASSVLPAPAGVPATSGVLRTRVRYCECDPMNVAHHASYIPWLEMGRTELLRASGVSYADFERAGVYLVITRLELKYRRPILYDDVVEVRTRWIGGSRIKIEHEYELFVVERGGKPTEAADAMPVAVGRTTLACVGRDARPRPLPDWLTSG